MRVHHYGDMARNASRLRSLPAHVSFPFQMGAVEIIGLAASVSLLSGWRLYLTMFVVGLAMRVGWLPLPEQLAALDILANPWVMGAAALGAVAEFCADKIAWIDSIWDGVNTAVRPIGGALLALAIVDPSDPAWQVIVLLLGGGAALASHGAKAGTRAAVNTSPEPVSNIVVSTAEDVTTGGLLALAIAFPGIAILIALVLLAMVAAMLWLGWKVIGRLRGKREPTS